MASRGRCGEGFEVYGRLVTRSRALVPGALAALAALLLVGCGGANQEDVQNIVGGQNPTTVTPVSLNTPSPTPGMQATPITPGVPPARSIQFSSTSSSTIGVRGSGIAEQAALRFRVVDAQARPLSGITIDFTIVPSSLGGEEVNPQSAVSDATGSVQTVLLSGTRTAAVRVVAQVRSGNVSVQSTQIAILGAPPSAARFSMAAQFLNVSGRVLLGIEDKITTYVNDRFGNAVAPGTVVSFITNGASIVNSVPTGTNGEAVATLITEAGDIPPLGTVQVLAATRGEESFTDMNGNGIYDQGEPFVDIPEPFIDVNGNGKYDPDNPYERFIDTNANGVWDAEQQPGAWRNDVLIWETFPVTFSAHTRMQVLTAEEYATFPDLKFNFSQPDELFSIPNGGGQQFFVVIRDLDSNPIVGESEVTISVVQDLEIVGPTTFKLGDAQTFGEIVPGLNVFSFFVKDRDPERGVQTVVGVTVSVSSNDLPAGGNGGISLTRTGILGAVPTPRPTTTPPPPPTNTSPPTPTGTITPPATFTMTVTPAFTPTATSTPAAAHIQLALFVNQASANGDGTLSSVISALVTDANGVTVGNGIPVAFSLVAPVVPGVSVTSPALTGAPPGCTLGFPVAPQPGDALSCVRYNAARQGEMVTVQAVVQSPSGPLVDTQTITLPDVRPTPTATFSPSLTPRLTPTPTVSPTPTSPPAHLVLTLGSFGSDNLDGTTSTVISGFLTNPDGTASSDGIPVRFFLTAPVAGVAVTDPGITGAEVPCSLCFQVPPEPGDALSCVKYDSSRIGQSVTIRAQVMTAQGPLFDEKTLVLPPPSCDN